MVEKENNSGSDAKAFCGTYNLISFKKENFILKKNGQDIVKYRRVARPISELYAELCYVKSQLKSDEAVEIHIDGLQNIKMGLDFFSALKKAGVKIYDTWFGEVMKVFDDETVYIPAIAFKVSDLVSMDRLARVSNSFN